MVARVTSLLLVHDLIENLSRFVCFFSKSPALGGKWQGLSHSFHCVKRHVLELSVSEKRVKM